MKLSKRISGLKPSPTVSLNAKAKDLAGKGVKIYNFAVGEPDYTTPSVIVDEAIASLKAGRTKYGAAGGGLALRQAISEKLKRDNELTLDPNQIVAGIGAKEILFHIFLALLDEGDEVIVPAPYWVSYTAHIEAAGAVPIIIPMADDINGPRLTGEMIAQYATPKTRAIVLTSPNNPAGYVLSTDELADIGNYLQKQDWWIIADEIYEYMAFDRPHRSLLNVVPALQEKFILVNGMSKGYAMTGWRVGYCATVPAVAKLVRNLQSHSSTCLPGFIEDAAVKALSFGPSLMAQQIDVLRRRRDLAIKELAKIDNIQTCPSEGAFYAYIDLRRALQRSQEFSPANSLRFSEKLLELYHVAMVPGEAFGTDGFLRLSYAVHENDLVEGIALLGKAIKEWC